MRKLLIIFLFIFPFSFINPATTSTDCYTTWNDGYINATALYHNYMEQANSKFSPPKARLEVEAWYTNQINTLGDAFFDCVYN